MSPTTQSAGGQKYAWWRELTSYHWFVLSVASMGWMFDTMAQQLFNLARKPAINERLGAWRCVLRRSGGSHRPRQDDDYHHPQLHSLHRPERALYQRLELQRLPLPLRPGRG